MIHPIPASIRTRVNTRTARTGSHCATESWSTTPTPVSNRTASAVTHPSQRGWSAPHGSGRRAHASSGRTQSRYHGWTIGAVATATTSTAAALNTGSRGRRRRASQAVKPRADTVIAV